MARHSIEYSKKGLPCMWESGGGCSNTGGATIICAANGSMKTPIFIARGGPLSCGRHALIVIQPTDVIINASHQRGDFTITVEVIGEISKRLECVECDQIAEFSKGEWDKDAVAEQYADAIKAAMAKAQCYHCRVPYYVQQ